MLTNDACSRVLISARFHNLHAGDIRGVVGEITSYHERDYPTPFYGSCGFCIFWPFFGLPFFFLVSLVMVSAIDLLLDFCVFDLLKKYVAILLSMESQIFGDGKASK